LLQDSPTVQLNILKAMSEKQAMDRMDIDTPEGIKSGLAVDKAYQNTPIAKML